MKPRPKSIKLMFIKNCAEMIANLEYIKGVFGMRYRLTTDDIIRLKDEDKAQTKS